MTLTIQQRRDLRYKRHNTKRSTKAVIVETSTKIADIPAINYTLTKNDDKSVVVSVQGPQIEGDLKLKYAPNKRGVVSIEYILRQVAMAHKIPAHLMAAQFEQFNKVPLKQLPAMVKNMMDAGEDVHVVALWNYICQFNRTQISKANRNFKHQEGMFWFTVSPLSDRQKGTLMYKSYIMQAENVEELYHRQGQRSFWLAETARRLNLDEETKNDQATKNKFLEHVRAQLVNMNVLEFEQIILSDPWYNRTISELFYPGSNFKPTDLCDVIVGLLSIEQQAVYMYAHNERREYFLRGTPSMFDSIRPMMVGNFDNMLSGKMVRSERDRTFNLGQWIGKQESYIRNMATCIGIDLGQEDLGSIIQARAIKARVHSGFRSAGLKVPVVGGNYVGRTNDSETVRVENVVREYAKGLQIISKGKPAVDFMLDTAHATETRENLKKAARKIQNQIDDRKSRQSAKTKICDRDGNWLDLELTGASLGYMPKGSKLALLSVDDKKCKLAWFPDIIRLATN